jgi:hypothetical protein
MQEPPAAASQALRPPSGAAGIISGLTLSVVECTSFDAEDASRSGSEEGIARIYIQRSWLVLGARRDFLKVEGR